MSNDIQKFDPSRLMDGVRDRIKATFVSLIPDEQWEQMIQKSCDDFFREVRRDYNHSRSQDVCSDFQMVVREELSKYSRERIKVVMETYTSEIWENDGFKPNDKIKELIIQYAPEIFASMFASRFQQCINDMKNRGY